MIPNKLTGPMGQRDEIPFKRTRLEGLLLGGVSVEMVGVGSTIKWPDNAGE